MKNMTLSLLIGFLAQPLLANPVCDILDKTLPGPVDVKVEIPALAVNKDLSGTISKKTDTTYTIVGPEGSTNFTLQGKGEGEATTCRIVVDAGMEGDLTHMDLEKGLFVFGDDSNIKLTVNKKSFFNF